VSIIKQLNNLFGDGKDTPAKHFTNHVAQSIISNKDTFPFHRSELYINRDTLYRINAIWLEPNNMVDMIKVYK
jgi:hypothetical protein